MTVLGCLEDGPEPAAGLPVLGGIDELPAVLARGEVDRIIVAFGVLITGRPESDPAAVAAGWIYHFWNGISFATMYVLIAGRGRWPSRRGTR